MSVEFLRLASIGRATGCAIIVAERRSAAATERGLTREHGPLAGVAAVGDLALLARATDGFVGSAQSSFSVLAWAVASSRRGAAPPLRTLPGCRRDGANGTIRRRTWRASRAARRRAERACCRRCRTRRIGGSVHTQFFSIWIN